MKKEGFLLVEVVIAMAILAMIFSAYAWYQWQVSCKHINMTRHLHAITMLSNSIECLTAHEQQLCDDNGDSAIVCKPLEKMPPLAGILPQAISLEQSGYTIVEVTATWRTAEGKQGVCTCYAGLMS